MQSRFFSGEKATSNRQRGRLSVSLWLIPIYFLLLSASIVVTGFPVAVLGWQLLISLVTFGMYGLDKSAAKNSLQRTSESTLHLLAIAGGWPGALLAQQMLRHKSKKQTFRFSFWVTVVLSVLIVVWLHSNEGRKLIDISAEKVTTLWNASLY